MYVRSHSASPGEDEGSCAPASPPRLSCCSFTQVIPGCRARQETCLCSGEHDSWLAETHKKSEKSGLKYQRSAKVPKLRACPCQNG